ncbi:protein-glutamate O-methyltransferase CheR [bacterium]|nr:protein-glutamate O-methyltransferase CheR [bacterium]
MADPLNEVKIHEIFDILKKKFDSDFTSYKINCLSRRIKRRMMLCKLEDIDDYISLIRIDEKEVNVLYKTITINVTRFFRDEATYDYIYDTILPEIADRRHLNIWSAGCASGEEPYSIAMLLQNYKITKGANFRFTVFATDIDTPSVEIAQKGVYTPKSLFSVTGRFRNVFNMFSQRQGNYYHIIPEIREKVEFKIQNLINSSWDVKFDLILCRNVFIYFSRELQNQILNTFRKHIRDDGQLVLGRVETIFSDGKTLFDVVSNKNKVYKKKRST